MSVKEFFVLLALGLAIIFGAWWDQGHPFPVQVIRNGRAEVTQN